MEREHRITPLELFFDLVFVFAFTQVTTVFLHDAGRHVLRLTASDGHLTTVQDVAIALRNSADSAAKLVPVLSGYRAGLVGSIAAACTAAFTLGLTPPRSPARRPR